MHAFTETSVEQFEFCLPKKNNKNAYIFPVTVWSLDSPLWIAALLSDPLQSNFKCFGAISTDVGAHLWKITSGSGYNMSKVDSFLLPPRGELQIICRKFIKEMKKTQEYGI